MSVPKILILALFVCLPLIATAQTDSRNMLALTMAAKGGAQNTNDDGSIVFQLVQDQILFNKSTVESASLSEPQAGMAIYGLYLKLKPQATKQIERLSENNLGKSVNIILNKQVISSPIIQGKLSGQFLIVGFTKPQAEQFIQSLQ